MKGEADTLVIRDDQDLVAALKIVIIEILELKNINHLEKNIGLVDLQEEIADLGKIQRITIEEL